MIELRGAHAKLLTCRDREVLLEGPVGTGKTRALCEKARLIAERFHGARILFCRKTRVSMTESVLVTWEQQVLGWNHPAIVGTATRGNRGHYVFPGGTEVVIGGLDNADRILSTEYDLICIYEASEVSQEDLEKLGTRLRNWVVPWQQLVCDTNPRGALHWLNLRAEEGLMSRLLSRHWMNPALYDTEAREWTKQGREYLAGVAKGLTGARFAQLFLGRWASDIGLIYPMYDPSLHDREFDLERDKTGRIFLHLKETTASGRPKPPVEIKWTIASADWGYTCPGAMQVWGVDADQNSWMLAELYRTEEHQDWWADRLVEFKEEFNLRRVVCDPAEPDRIDYFNDRLGVPGGRRGSRIAVGGNNSVLAGIAHVQALMTPDRPTTATERTPGPKVYYKKNAIRHRDESLVAERRPWCLTMEKAGYYWDKNEEGRPIKERPNPTNPDHAMDAERYGLMWIWKKDLTAAQPIHRIQPGTMADLLGHKRKLEEQRRRRMQ